MTERGRRFSDRYQSLRSLWSSKELRDFGVSAHVGYILEEPSADIPVTSQISMFELDGYLCNTLLRDCDVMSMAHALEPNGRLLLSVGGSDPADFSPCGTDEEGFTSEMHGHTFFYSGYEPSVARKLLETAGFEIELWEVDDPTSRGHIAVIARRLS